MTDNPYTQNPQPTQQPQSIREPKNGFGITALILAIVGLVFGLIPLTGFIALTLGAIALLFALLGWGRVRRGVATNKKMSAIGGLLGVGAIALGIWGLTIVFGAVEDLDKELDKIGDDMKESSECIDALDIDDPDFAAKMAEC